MNIQYFKASWGDIKNSPGWFGKLCLLALLNFIPIFGQIVTYGYLYGWAREIAWGTHEPLPSRIFANEDGKMYRRGWFVLVLVWVFMLVPYIVMAIGNSLQGAGFSFMASGHSSAAASVSGWLGAILSFVGWLGLIFVGIIAWIGCMRISIYDRLSAGFQFSKIWKMFRHDTGGIMRIFGMELLFGFIIGIILSIIFTILIAIVVSVGISGIIGAGYSLESLQYMTDSQAVQVAVAFLSSAGLVGFISLIIGMFVGEVALLFVQMLVTRAVGYWTMQFDVPRWGGQDTPMPFEMAGVPQPVQPVPPQAAPPTDPNSPYASAYQTQPMTPDPGYTPPVAPVSSTMSTVPIDQTMSTQAMPTQAMPTQAMPTAPVEPVYPVEFAEPAQFTEPMDVEDMPAVEYGEPVVVGAEFVMTSDEIAAVRDVEQEAVSDSALEEASPIESELKPNEAPQVDDAEDVK